MEPRTTFSIIDLGHGYGVCGLCGTYRVGRKVNRALLFVGTHSECLDALTRVAF